MKNTSSVHLVADIGNTSSKIAVFKDSKIVATYTVAGKETKEKVIGVCEKTKPSAIIISSVTANTLKPILPALRKKYTRKVISFSHSTALPFKNKYLSPETLGNDRLANAAAANYLFPAEDVLVIDAGTCLKFDFVSRSKGYLGGSISPGLNMRFRSLHTFTAKLPLYEPQKTKILTGRNTMESIYAGVYLGMLGEIKEMLHQYKLKYPEIKIILTGGDMDLFVKELKNGIFADRFATLKGLNAILEHNA